MTEILLVFFLDVCETDFTFLHVAENIINNEKQIILKF